MGRNQPFGKKKLKALYATYGEENLYNSGNFQPLTRNLTTKKMLNRGHHCDRCKAKMSMSCFDAFHYAFCPTWVTRKGKRERCGERFCVHSDGCGKHSRVQGYNEPLYRAANGEDVDLSEFDDPDPLNLKGEAEDDEDDLEAEQEAREEAEEELIKEHGHVPAIFYKNYWTERGKQKAYEQQIKIEATRKAATIVAEDMALNPAVISNGKTGTGKKVKNRNTVIANLPIPRNDRGAGSRATYGGHQSALQNQSDDDTPLRSYAPKRSKPKLPKEAPRYPAGQQGNGAKETNKERAKRFVASMVLGKNSET